MGVLAALVAAYIFGMQRKAQPPVFKPVSNPYDSAIYANGIIESDQSSGENINIFPEVSGSITKVLAHEGQQVTAGTPLFTIDDSVQRATTEQLRLQSEAALALLDELKAQPRPETLAIAEVAGGSGRIQPESGPRPVPTRTAPPTTWTRNPSARSCWIPRKTPPIRRPPPWTWPASNMN